MGRAFPFPLFSCASLSFVHKHTHELLGGEKGILLSAGSAGPILTYPQPSVSQHGSAARHSSQVGSGESPLLGARSKTMIHMAACSAPKGPSLEGFGLGFDTLRRKVGEKLLYGR